MRAVPDFPIMRIALAVVAAAVLAVLAGTVPPAAAQLIPAPPADTLPPTVEITEAPKSELRTHKAAKPVVFQFTSDDPLATFTCRVDRSGYLPCTSPFGVRFAAGKGNAGNGIRHTFLVRSADLAGNSAGVAVRSVRVKRVKPFR